MSLRRSMRLCALCRCQQHTNVRSSEWCVGKPLANPLDDLKPLLQIPLIQDDSLVFKPTLSEVRQAQKVFQGGDITPLRGIVDLDQLPARNLPEVAFIGQSNVGKSSLVKALFATLNPKTRHRLTVSKKPGHTRTLRFYEVPRKFSLVDMPGYGENMPEHFVRSAESYIMTRHDLRNCVMMVDASTGLNEADRIGLEMMQECSKPYTLVLTKIDKAPHSQVLKTFLALNEYREENLNAALPQIFLVSSLCGAGIPLLRSFIAYITGNVKISNH